MTESALIYGNKKCISFVSPKMYTTSCAYIAAVCIYRIFVYCWLSSSVKDSC